MNTRHSFCIICICLTVFAAHEASAQSVPAQILEESERTYNNRIGARPDHVASCLYPFLEPCAPSPTAILVLKDGRRQVTEQSISEEGRRQLENIENLTKNKQHKKLYELNRLYAGDRGFVKALTLRGKVFLNMRAYSRALSPLLKAIEANPIDYEAYNYLGYSYLKMNELDAAREAYIKAILYNPQNNVGWKGLKNVGEELGFDPEKRRIRKGAWMVRVSEKEIDFYIDTEIQHKETVGPWMSYITAKAAWLYEGVFEDRHSEAEGYFYTVEEDLYACDFMLEYWQHLKTKKQVSDPDLDFLLEVRQKGLLPAYFLFEEAGPICPEIISVQPPETIAQIKSYIESFVLVQAKKPDETGSDASKEQNSP